MRQREGYLMVDHSASPGLPEDIARASGYDPLMCKEGKRLEAATLTCAHCKVTVVKSPLRSRPRETCMKCSGHYICDVCAFRASLPAYTHTPFDRYVDMTADLYARGLTMNSYSDLLFGNPLLTARPLPVAEMAPAPQPAPTSQKELTNG